MIVRPSGVFAVIWIGWAVSWIAAAFWSGTTAKRAVTWEIWVYRGLVLIGVVLLSHAVSTMLHEPRLWQVGLVSAYALAALTVSALAFTWWARLNLGPLWSSSIARKENHRLIDSGPYRLVRHPIYAGLILAMVAAAAAQATATGLVGAATIAFALWLKARAEERFLMSELGADVYDAYRRRVPMLVPGIRRR